jgi:enoyl-CoA hydratase
VAATDGHVLLERTGNIAVVTINRPAKLNDMTVEMDREMNEITYELNNDESVRAILLAGAGDGAFCAGSDVTDLDEYGSNWQMRNRFDARKDYAHAVWRLRKPEIGRAHV